MRIAAKVLVLSMVAGVLGSADATAPDLANAPAALLPTGASREISLSRASGDGDSISNRALSDSDTAAPEQDGDDNFWLLGGVAFGLVLYQLRRKHRLLRPQPFVLRPDL